VVVRIVILHNQGNSLKFGLAQEHQMADKVPPIIFWPHIKNSSSPQQEANINSCKYFKIISCYNK
jgi:hypothetical protein